jgi:uncharacterized protein (TIGR02646 family)
MIKISRPDVRPASLEKPYGSRVKKPKVPGMTETDAVKKHVEDWISQGKLLEKLKFPYERYSDREVVESLREMFHGKCAYCESRYAGTQPMDVEHWRPKGEIRDQDQEPIKPGYYWLAADWENLLPSCIDCNRARTQFDQLDLKQIVLGKKNQFPLQDPGKRILAHEEFETKGSDAEGPLLINPCRDDPEEFFSYDEQGLILPSSTDENSVEFQRAMASIRVYALNRADLVADRLQLILRIDHRLNTIEVLSPIRDKLQNEPLRLIQEADALSDLIAAEIDELLAMKRPERPFAGLARQIINNADPSA